MSPHDQRSLTMLGAAVRMCRRQRGWSQRELEERSGVDQTTVSRIERGRVRGTQLIKLAWIAWALDDAMPLGGCPHDHRCAFSLRRAAVLEDVLRLVPDTDDSLDDPGGPDLLDLLLRDAS
ncbi:MAG: helix-turn-helix domain-containing protein [Chloroflexota bacterium]